MIERNGYRSKYTPQEAAWLLGSAENAVHHLRAALDGAKQAKAGPRTLGKIREALKAANVAVRHGKTRLDWAQRVAGGR